MKKVLFVILFFFMGFIFFMPKINLYYTLENFIKKEHIVIKEESMKDRWIDLDIKNAQILYDGIESVDVGELSISPWLFYNKVSASDVQPAQALKNMLNVKADSVSITHSILNYKVADIKASGDFGEISGEANLIDRKVHLLLNPSESFKNNKMLRDYFKKSEDGFVYESKF